MPRYTPEQLRLRNASIWTKVQIILAPIQFAVFIAGFFITYFYVIGEIENFAWVTWGVAIKTIFLLILFITGAFFEKEVFGEWVFSPEFYWEDIGSTIAVAVHFMYFILALFGLDETTLIWAAFAAYTSYVLNALQYLVRIWLEKRNEKRLRAEGLV